MVDSDSDEDENIIVTSRDARRQKKQALDVSEHEGKQDDEQVATGQEGRSRRHRRERKRNEKRKKLSNKNLQGANGGYAWEDEIKRSWDLVKVDEDGDMSSLAASIIESRKKRTAQKNVTPYQRGIIRTLVLVLDCSEAMLEKDMRPNRHVMMVQYAIDFVHEFFDQNPISQMGIVGMRNGLAQLITPVSGNPQDHIDALKVMRKQEPKGNPSLQNSLEMARGLLLPVPAHCTKEVLIIFGSLSSADPGDIHQTIACLVHESIRVKVIGLSAQVSICRELCKQTNYGDESFYKVPLDETHCKELFDEAVIPLPVNKINKGFTLVRMGFPTRIFEESPTFCSCHSKLTYGGYICPNCYSKVCSLPTVCPCCNLMLILSTHLARSYHHLMPLKTFKEVPSIEIFPTENCFSCQLKFPTIKNHRTGELLTSSRYRCEDCKKDFCIDCDVFIHETLHNCPGCESQPVII